MNLFVVTYVLIAIIIFMIAWIMKSCLSNTDSTADLEASGSSSHDSDSVSSLDETDLLAFLTFLREARAHLNDVCVVPPHTDPPPRYEDCSEQEPPAYEDCETVYTICE